MSVEKIKEHIKRHKMFYISAGCVALGIGIAVLAGRIVKNHQIGVELLDAASVELLDAGKTVGSSVFINKNTGNLSVLNYIDQRRPGSPSWVVRCLETDAIFSSQRKAAEALELSQADLSRHLNGLKDHVNNLHFERICMAA